MSWEYTVDERHDVGRFVAATSERVLSAVDRDETVALRALTTDGREAWRRRLSLREFWPGGVVDGTIYGTDGVTDLVAVDASDGSLRWRQSLYDQAAESVPEEFLALGGAPERFEPVVVPTPQTVYAASAYGLHGVAPADGTEQWRIYLGESTAEPRGGRPFGLAPTADAVWVVDHRRGVLRVGRQVTGDGEQVVVRRGDTGLDSPTAPVITGDGRAVVGPAAVWSTRSHRPVAAAAGRRGWQFPGFVGEGTSTFAKPVTNGRRVFCCVAREQPGEVVVTALQAETGALDWRVGVTPAASLPPLGDGAMFRLAQSAVAGDTLLVGYGSDPRVFDGPAGDSRTATDDRAGSDGRGQGELLGFAVGDGRLRWRRDLPVGPERVAVTGTTVLVYGHRGDVVAF